MRIHFTADCLVVIRGVLGTVVHSQCIIGSEPRCMLLLGVADVSPGCGSQSAGTKISEHPQVL